MTSLKPEKGILLVAEPSIIGDVSFNRSIILLAEINDNGSVGFILNKQLEYTLNDLLPELDCSIQVYNGGPVEQDNLYFIHKVPDLIPGSIEISNGIYWGGDFDIVKRLLQNNKLNENQIRFFLGYTGWAFEQLEEELELKSWVIIPNTYKNNIIGMSYDNFWKEKMIELGGDYALFSNAPENPNYN